ncbi:MAG: hypothetical protein H7256_16575 [Bdellovibrio sp.]|nr:hypothetical protein [Bdellovibrio sp.]
MSKNEYCFLLLIFVSSFVASCSEKSNTEKAEGSVSVQIPVQDSADAYSLKTVTLLGIADMKTVAGSFTKFFYSPGSTGSELTGKAPMAHFAETGSVFFPTDYISAQMATIYYHMQNLAAFDNQIGAGSVNTWPRAVGLETIIKEEDGFRKNNAFYDGQTDAMMFVPFTNQDLPISVNAGIIAHEHFHSLFYKLVLKTAVQNNKVLTNAASIHDGASLELKPASKMQNQNTEAVQKVQLYNEAYLRGVNEGIADFWGWTYTEDINFMKWSLPAYVGDRTLALSESGIGRYQTKSGIEIQIDNFQATSSEIHNSIMSYSYTVGTPHARFLKMLTNIYANETKATIANAKLKVAQDVILFLKSLQQNLTSLKDDQGLAADGLFQFMADQRAKDKTMTDQTCQFLAKYLNYAAEKSQVKCETKDNQVVLTSTSSVASK